MLFIYLPSVWFVYMLTSPFTNRIKSPLRRFVAVLFYASTVYYFGIVYRLKSKDLDVFGITRLNFLVDIIISIEDFYGQQHHQTEFYLLP